MAGADDRPEDLGDEAYYDDPQQVRAFDSRLLREPLSILPARKPLVFGAHDPVTEAMRAMQGEHRGCVVVTEDGSPQTRLLGIFTERDVLFRIVDRGKNPATLPLSEVMTRDPERLPLADSVARALNMMCLGGFRHVPVVDENDCPAFVVSVRDVVELLVEHFPREILNLPEYTRKNPTSREGA